MFKVKILALKIISYGALSSLEDELSSYCDCRDVSENALFDIEVRTTDMIHSENSQSVNIKFIRKNYNSYLSEKNVIIEQRIIQVNSNWECKKE